jgi:large subunit ribosomal protein L18
LKIGPRYKIPFKRRFKSKTDYRQRLSLLTSEKHRLVVRKSLNHVTAQIINFKKEGDQTLVHATSQELKKFGWSGPTSNLVGAYFTGLLIGKKALKKDIKSAILDVGLIPKSKGSRVFAVLKGALDAGLDIPHSAEILPSDDRIKGKHIIDYAQKLKKEDLKLYKKQFSTFDPEKLSEIYDNVKSKIMEGSIDAKEKRRKEKA